MMNQHKLKAAFLILILIAALVFFLKDRDQEDDRIMIDNAAEIQTSSESAIQDPLDIIVDVSGAVKVPSVVKLPEGSRVYEAIEAAGGLNANASINSLNRAAVLQDGDKIYIPTVEEPQSTSGHLAGSMSPANTGSRVNINTADTDELQSLSGIGPSTADKIIQFRNSNGQFRSIEGLMDVNGIGEKTFEKIKDKLCI